jgi:photosystem II stability/assembly factor-like uncharacterized protein
MKRFITWSALIGLTVAIGTLALARGVVSRAQLTPTATPPSRPTSAEKRLPWESLGGPYERVAFALAFAPASKTLYAGTWGHGVYSSWDGGQTWQSNGTGGGQYVRVLTTLPSSEDGVVYAGTYNQGLRRGTDGGLTWKQLGSYSDFTAPPDPAHFNRSSLRIESLLIFSDQGAQRILAGTHNGVWSSEALSDTWTHLNSGFANTDEAYKVRALAHDPAGRLYAGTEDGLYGSQDGGQTWQRMGPPKGYPPEARRIVSLAVVTDTANYTGTLLIGTHGAGIYALDMESQSWLTRTVGFPDYERARTIQALLSAPDGMAYAGTVDFGMFETRDSGQTWQQRAEHLPSNSRSIVSLARDPADGTLYAGTYGDGVYRLRAGNEQWEPAKGASEKARLPVDFPVQRIAFAGPDGERLLAGLQVGGMYSNTIRQYPMPPWERLPKALPIGPDRDVPGLVVSGPDRSTVVVTAGTGIFRSTDAGKTWVRLGSTHNLPDGDVKGQALVQGRNNPNVLYAALENEVGVYRSVNAGERWEPVPGDLDPALRNQVCCLAVGTDDYTVYLGLKFSQVYTRQVYITHDAGATWQPLSRIGNEALQERQELRELDWSQRTAWDVFLHGGQRRMLYARTNRSIYVSYDEGQSWQLRMRGLYSALWADPYRPWVVYIASPDVTLDREFVLERTGLTPDLWVSYDGLETWTWAGPGPSLAAEEPPASITTLALDPTDENLLYAGTEGAGVFRADLSSVMPPYRSYTPRAVGLLLLSMLFLGAGAYVIQAGLSLGRPYGLPPHTWPQLAYLQARHADEMGLVSDPHTPLTSLERLVLALAPDEELFHPEVIRQQLENAGTPTPFSQIETTLNRLALHYSLLHHDDGNYRLAWSLLGQMAHARFWDDVVEREKLVDEVRGESLLRADTHRFLTQCGFDTSPFETGFKATSRQPEYTLLGADRGIYVHLHTATAVDMSHVRQVRDGADRAYEGQLSGKAAFLVVSGPPHVEAYQHIARLWHEEGLHIVPLPHGRMRHTADTTTSRRQINQSLRRALGNRDLFQLDSPTVDLLDFFGRETYIQELVDACRDGRVIGLGGMVGVGKTSLAQQVIDHLPQAIVAWIDLTAHPHSGLYAAVRQSWLTDARLRFPQWEWPQLVSLPEQPALAQIQNDLTTICESLCSQTPARLLAVVLDGLTDFEARSEAVATMTRAIALTEGTSLLGVFDAWPWHTASFQMYPLRPFGQETTATMVDSLAVQMELDFDSAAVEQLHLASGGHPLVLRQLASLAITPRRDSIRPIDIADVEKAISQYVSRPNPTLSRLWVSLAEEEQRVLLSTTGTRPPPPNELTTLMTELGWLRQVDGQPQLFSQALMRWLDARRSSQQ